MIETYRVTWGGECAEEVTDADEAVELVDHIVAGYAPSGDRGLAFVGPSACGPKLAIGIDADHGRAVARWLDDAPSGYAVEQEVTPYPKDITFYVDEQAQPWVCGPDATRLRPETAREIVREYVRTGQRPTNVSWNAV